MSIFTPPSVAAQRITASDIQGDGFIIFYNANTAVPLNVPAGALIIVALTASLAADGSLPVSSVLDDIGNKYHQITPIINANGTVQTIFYCLSNAFAGRNTVQISTNGGEDFIAGTLAVIPISGGYATFDSQGSGTGTGTAAVTGAFTAASADEFVLAVCASQTSSTSNTFYTAGAGYTAISRNYGTRGGNPTTFQTIPGSHTGGGAFVFGETVTQTTSGATGVVQEGLSNRGTLLLQAAATGTPDATHTWVGGTSGAVWTPTAVPTLYAWAVSSEYQLFASSGSKTAAYTQATATDWTILAAAFAANTPGTHTISGNCGIANGYVFYQSTDGTDLFGNTQADGAGHYSLTLFTGVAYNIWPSAVSTAFTGANGNHTAITVSADATVNFTATALTATALGSDNFTRANENPILSPWAALFGYAAPAQLLSDFFAGTNVGSNASYFSTALASKTASYMQVVLHAIEPFDAGTFFSGEMDAYMNADTSGIGGFEGFFYINGSGTLVSQIFAVDTTVTYQFNPIATFSPANNVLRVENYGGKQDVYLDGVCRSSVLAAGSATGQLAALGMLADVDNSLNQWGAFEVGNLSAGAAAVGWSPVDSRVAPFGPNTGVVQSDGSVFYTGQTSSNPAVPSVDSRAAGAPVDSRVSKPVNSRVNPNP